MNIFTANGTLYFANAGDTAYQTFTLPADITPVNGAEGSWLPSYVRPSFANYKGRTYIGGYFNRVVVIDEDRFVNGVGIRPPTAPPTVAASGTGVTGAARCYLSFVHKLPNGVKVAESNITTGTSVTLANNSRAWSALPTTAPDPRVTHIRGYVSMDGSSPFLAWERELGASAVTEAMSTATLSSQETVPIDDTTLLPTYERGVPQYARFLEVYHDRLWYAGVANPDRIYYSRIGEPEAVGENSYLITRDGEAITGIKRVGDVLIVFTATATYDIQGYEAADFRVRKIQPSVGCISHHGIVNINEVLWFPTQIGIYAYDGARFHFITINQMDTWIGDYAANRQAFENSIGIDDRTELYYKLMISGTAGPVTQWVVKYHDYDPAVNSGDTMPPAIMFDRRGRHDITHGLLPISTGASKFEVATGSSDGYVRYENQATDDDDDGDSEAKTSYIITKHYFGPDQLGDKSEGKSLLRLYCFVVGEDASWTISVYGGDEYAKDGAAMYSNTVPASASTGFVKKGRHYFAIDKASGHGFTYRFGTSSALEWIFRGFGGVFGPGPGRRG